MVSYGVVRRACFCFVLVAGVLTGAVLTSCTIDFDEPFAETGWYDRPDAGADGKVEASSDGSSDGTPDRVDADHCDDDERNGDETDLDCGGSCPPCAIGRSCGRPQDCSSDACVDGVCCESACTGTCQACSEEKTEQPDGVCWAVAPGSDPDDECSGGYNCGLGGCESCDDGLQNGDETGVDCGGDCPPCSEDCTNGTDDDGNGLVDCEDPACASFTCLPEVPAGWDGPVMLFAGSGTMPDCGFFQTVVEGGLEISSYPPANCPACSCSAPTGESCPMPVVELYDSGSCSAGPDLVVSPSSPGTCRTFQDTVEYDSARVLPAQPSGGSCQASAGPPDVPDFEWPDPALVCEADVPDAGGGCEDSGCVPRPPAPYLPQYCVFREGLLPCPGTNYDRFVVYDTFSDTRACSGCTCSSPDGGTCAGQVSVYGSSSCSGATNDVPTDGSCAGLSGSILYESLSYEPDGPSGSSCTPSGGVPVGSVKESDPVTVCCGS